MLNYKCPALVADNKGVQPLSSLQICLNRFFFFCTNYWEFKFNSLWFECNKDKISEWPEDAAQWNAFQKNWKKKYKFQFIFTVLSSSSKLSINLETFLDFLISASTWLYWPSLAATCKGKSGKIEDIQINQF